MNYVLLVATLFTQGGTDWISFSLLEGFPVTFSNNLCGINTSGTQELMATDPVCDSIFFIDTSTGTLNSTLPITPGCANAYGICTAEYQGTPYYFCNDTSSTSTTYLWRYEFGPWAYGPNPASGQGRGMDYNFNDEYLWQASVESSNSLVRCRTDGSSSWTYTISEIDGEISGVCTFPFEGETGLLITGKTDDQFHLYKSVLGVLIYQGSGTVPDTSADVSLDLTGNGYTFWWCYRKQNIQYLAKIEMEITQNLEAQTWAAIKAAL